MTKQTQAAESDQDKKQKKPQIEPVAPQSMGELVPLGSLPIAPQAAAGSDPIEGQASFLRDRPWQGAQRRAITAQIGRVQGNQHLQRMIASTQRSHVSSITPALGAARKLIARQEDLSESDYVKHKVEGAEADVKEAINSTSSSVGQTFSIDVHHKGRAHQQDRDGRGLDEGDGRAGAVQGRLRHQQERGWE
jgi:hypothetical protein